MVDHSSQLPVLLGHLGEVVCLIQAVKDEHQELVTVKAEAKKVTKEQAATIQQLNDKIRHLEDKGNTTSDQCDDNETQARQKEAELQTTLDSLEQELKKEKMAHTESIKAYGNRVTETQEDFTQQIKSLQENYDRALVENQHLSEARETVEKKAVEIQQLTDKLHLLETKEKEAIQQAAARESALRGNIESLTEEIKKEKTAHKDDTKAYENLISKMEKESERKLKSLQEASDGVFAENLSIKEKVNDLSKLEMTNGHLQEQVASLSKSLEVENRQKQLMQNKYEELARTKCEIEEKANRHSCEWEALQNSLQERIKTLEKDNETLKTDFQAAKMRISQVLGERLAANADVSDLSDPYKVTKIAEMYVDVYDEQWTEAYEVAEKVFEERDEKYRIRKIIQILGLIYSFCKKESLRQKDEFVQSVLRLSDTSEMADNEVLVDHLKSCRRQTVDLTIQHVYAKCFESVGKDEKLGGFAMKLPSFVRACCKLCWLMLIQTPPVVILTNLTKGWPFDARSYTCYTVRGNTVDFVVWPALLLHEGGPILAKGVVQCLRPEKKTGQGAPVVKQPSIKENTDDTYTEEGCNKERQTSVTNEGANEKPDHDGKSQENENELKQTSASINESNTEMGTNTTYQNDFGADECSGNEDHEEESRAQENDLPNKSTTGGHMNDTDPKNPYTSPDDLD